MINISIEEAAKKSFLEITQLVDENGAVTMVKDGREYIIFENNGIEKEKYIDSAKFREIAAKVLDRHLEAFKELAK